MRVLIVRPLLEYGGASISIFRLAAALQDEGHEPILAVAGGDLLQQAYAQHFRVVEIPLYPSTPFQFLVSGWQLQKIVRQERIDVIHSQHRFSNLVCKAVAVWLSVPLVTTVHEFKSNHRILTRLGIPDYTVTYSDCLRKHLIEHYGVEPERVIVVEMGIHKTPPGNGSNEFGKPSNHSGIRIGCFARLVEEKGVDILLQAAGHLRRAGQNNVRFLVVGEGPQRNKLAALSKELGVQKMFHFLGWVDEIDSFIPNLDFLVLPSRTEGFGMIILEGMRYKKPAVASNVGGIPELIDHGQTGLLVPPDDPHSLAEAILDLLANPNRVRSMGEAGFKQVSSRYFLKTMGEQMTAVYEAARQRHRL